MDEGIDGHLQKKSVRNDQTLNSNLLTHVTVQDNCMSYRLLARVINPVHPGLCHVMYYRVDEKYPLLRGNSLLSFGPFSRQV